MVTDTGSRAQQVVARARAVLRGQAIDPGEALALAKALMAEDDHYWARRLLHKLLTDPRRPLAHAQRQQLAQGLALATLGPLAAARPGLRHRPGGTGW